MQQAQTSNPAPKTVKLLKFFAEQHDLKINALLLRFEMGCSYHL